MTTQFYLVPGLRMCGAIPPLLLFTVDSKEGQLYLYHVTHLCY